MSQWKQSLTQFVKDILRLSLWVGLFMDAFMLVGFSVWFAANFLWHCIAYLGRTIFGSPW